MAKMFFACRQKFVLLAMGSNFCLPFQSTVLSAQLAGAL
jgi:hypothetical protein